MHEPEDADAEDADDDDEACSRRRRHGVPGREAQRQPSDFVGQVKKARVNPVIAPEL